jgi:Glycine rich protein
MRVRIGSCLAALFLLAGAVDLATGSVVAGATTPTDCPPALISGATATVTCSYNGTTGADGSAQTFTVPSGVTSITIDAFGAQGGGPAGGGGGGNGGEARATFSVIPGALLTVIAAGQGGDGPLTPDATPGAGGFGGGGSGGANYDGNFPGGGGGGASSVSDGMRVLVIGGGGGANSVYGIDYVAGGSGGGLSGTSGGRGAAPGTQSSGGTGVVGGGNGSAGQGGVGSTSGSCASEISGGGGGGGFYGGAGGAQCDGGGGGSGFIDPAATSQNFNTGANSGRGKVVITYTVPGGPIQITTASLPDATLHQSYNFQLGSMGGTPPYTLNKYGPKGRGVLPRGLSLSKSGLILGTPKQTGTFIIVVKCLDVFHNHKTQAVQELTLTVDP